MTAIWLRARLRSATRPAIFNGVPAMDGSALKLNLLAGATDVQKAKRGQTPDSLLTPGLAPGSPAVCGAQLDGRVQAIIRGEKTETFIHPVLAGETRCWTSSISTSGMAPSRPCSTSPSSPAGQGHRPDRAVRLRQVHPAALGQPAQRPDRHCPLPGRHAAERRFDLWQGRWT